VPAATLKTAVTAVLRDRAKHTAAEQLEKERERKWQEEQHAASAGPLTTPRRCQPRSRQYRRGLNNRCSPSIMRHLARRAQTPQDGPQTNARLRPTAAGSSFNFKVMPLSRKGAKVPKVQYQSLSP
jgi:hypothetical protein